MTHSFSCLLTGLLSTGLIVTATPGKADVSALYLQGQRPKAENAVVAYGPDLFGDQQSLFDGSWSIEHQDLELRGNFALPVTLARGAKDSKRSAVYALNQPLGDWNWAVPRMGGNFSERTGWKVGYQASSQRCSRFFAPPEEQNSTALGFPISAATFFHGVQIEVPGIGAQEVLQRLPAYTKQPPTGGPYPLVTRQNWQLSCIPQIQNGQGEGFYALSPEGVRYRFDWMGSRLIDPVRSGGMNLGRQEVYLYATEVTDRFGNWVRYSYDQNNPTRLTRIASSDRRQIDIQYSGSKAVSATDGTRTIRYAYGNRGELAAVTLPDGTQWKFGLFSLTPPGLGLPNTDIECDDGSSQIRPERPTGWVIHPAGAKLEVFTRWVAFERTSAPGDCLPVNGHLTMAYPPYSINLAVVEKRITSPTLPTTNSTSPNTLRWVFDYSDVYAASYPDAATFRLTSVTEPDLSITRHRFGNTWMVNEGLLLSVEKGWSNGSALRTTSYNYRGASGQAYPEIIGIPSSFERLGNYNLPIDNVTISQQGQRFIWKVAPSPAGFDDLARPLDATRSGTGGTRQELTTYYDRWDL